MFICIEDLSAKHLRSVLYVFHLGKTKQKKHVKSAALLPPNLAISLLNSRGELQTIQFPDDRSTVCSLLMVDEIGVGSILAGDSPLSITL